MPPVSRPPVQRHKSDALQQVLDADVDATTTGRRTAKEIALHTSVKRPVVHGLQSAPRPVKGKAIAEASAEQALPTSPETKTKATPASKRRRAAVPAPLRGVTVAGLTKGPVGALLLQQVGASSSAQRDKGHALANPDLTGTMPDVPLWIGSASGGEETQGVAKPDSTVVRISPTRTQGPADGQAGAAGAMAAMALSTAAGMLALQRAGKANERSRVMGHARQFLDTLITVVDPKAQQVEDLSEPELLLLQLKCAQREGFNEAMAVRALAPLCSSEQVKAAFREIGSLADDDHLLDAVETSMSVPSRANLGIIASLFNDGRVDPMELQFAALGLLGSLGDERKGLVEELNRGFGEWMHQVAVIRAVAGEGFSVPLAVKVLETQHGSLGKVPVDTISDAARQLEAAGLMNPTADSVIKALMSKERTARAAALVSEVRGSFDSGGAAASLESLPHDLLLAISEDYYHLAEELRMQDTRAFHDSISLAFKGLSVTSTPERIHSMAFAHAPKTDAPAKLAKYLDMTRGLGAKKKCELLSKVIDEGLSAVAPKFPTVAEVNSQQTGSKGDHIKSSKAFALGFDGSAVGLPAFVYLMFAQLGPVAANLSLAAGAGIYASKIWDKVQASKVKGLELFEFDQRDLGEGRSIRKLIDDQKIPMLNQLLDELERDRATEGFSDNDAKAMSVPLAKLCRANVGAPAKAEVLERAWPLIKDIPVQERVRPLTALLNNGAVPARIAAEAWENLMEIGEDPSVSADALSEAIGASARYLAKLAPSQRQAEIERLSKEDGVLSRMTATALMGALIPLNAVADDTTLIPKFSSRLEDPSGTSRLDDLFPDRPLFITDAHLMELGMNEAIAIRDADEFGAAVHAFEAITKTEHGDNNGLDVFLTMMSARIGKLPAEHQLEAAGHILESARGIATEQMNAIISTLAANFEMVPGREPLPEKDVLPLLNKLSDCISKTVYKPRLVIRDLENALAQRYFPTAGQRASARTERAGVDLDRRNVPAISSKLKVLTAAYPADFRHQINYFVGHSGPVVDMIPLRKEWR